MFRDPLLHELEYLHRQASAPEHGLRGDHTSGLWGDRFKAHTRLILNPKNKQKVYEANRLALFAVSYPGFPDGAISLSDPLDSILTISTQKIGIELRDVYVELPGQQPKKYQEAVQDKIVKSAKELYTKAGKPPVCVSVLFNDSTAYRDRDIIELADQLAQCVPVALAASKEWDQPNTTNGTASWPQGLVSVRGRAPYGNEPEDVRWEVSHCGSVYPGEHFIQAAIDKKEQKISRYRQSGCDELWLLVVVNGFAASSFLREPSPNSRFTSSFDRVFGFWVADGKAVELALARTHGGA